MILENWIINKLQEIEEMHEYSVATDTIRCWIDEFKERFILPIEVQKAQKYVQDCVKDFGFLGSPEYDKQKKIIDDYFEPIRKKEIEEKEKTELKRLQEKYKKDFSCYEIHTVQARMYGCNEQCAECLAESKRRGK